ncbi:MAG TPA: HEPN domain-containing protein [bacterium]|nr:HEPN domain-containing protein [bacterium]
MEDEEKAWLEFARRDLGAAQGLISLKYYVNACIDAQQAAEKALKAFILAKGKAIPKTHNLCGVDPARRRGGIRGHSSGTEKAVEILRSPTLPGYRQRLTESGIPFSKRRFESCENG